MNENKSIGWWGKRDRMKKITSEEKSPVKWKTFAGGKHRPGPTPYKIFNPWRSGQEYNTGWKESGHLDPGCSWLALNAAPNVQGRVFPASFLWWREKFPDTERVTHGVISWSSVQWTLPQTAGYWGAMADMHVVVGISLAHIEKDWGYFVIPGRKAENEAQLQRGSSLVSWRTKRNSCSSWKWLNNWYASQHQGWEESLDVSGYWCGYIRYSTVQSYSNLLIWCFFDHPSNYYSILSHFWSAGMVSISTFHAISPRIAASKARQPSSCAFSWHLIVESYTFNFDTPRTYWTNHFMYSSCIVHMVAEAGAVYSKSSNPQSQ